MLTVDNAGAKRSAVWVRKCSKALGRNVEMPISIRDKAIKNRDGKDEPPHGSGKRRAALLNFI